MYPRYGEEHFGHAGFLDELDAVQGFKKLAVRVIIAAGEYEIYIRPVSYTHLDVYKRQEINRTNLPLEEVEKKLELDVVQKQLEMLKFRNSFPAFGFDAELDVEGNGPIIVFNWGYKGCRAELKADLEQLEFVISGYDQEDNLVFELL